MSLVRSRRIPRADLEAWQTERRAQVAAHQQAAAILEAARTTALQRQEEQQIQGRKEAEKELAAQIIKAYQARDATLDECKETCLRILTDACQKYSAKATGRTRLKIESMRFSSNFAVKNTLQTPKSPQSKRPMD